MAMDPTGLLSDKRCDQMVKLETLSQAYVCPQINQLLARVQDHQR